MYFELELPKRRPISSIRPLVINRKGIFKFRRKPKFGNKKINETKYSVEYSVLAKMVNGFDKIIFLAITRGQ